MFKKLFKTSLYLGLLAGVVWAGLQRQAIFDWAQLQGYDPPARVVALANDTTMTDSGRRLFYINRPALDDRQNFFNHCGQNEQSIILGCFVSGQGIFVYDVQEPRLSGVHEVTAAHELLHAVYQRLDPKERTKIDAELDSVFQKLTNERIKKSIEIYRQKDPSVVPNELHSILGTEVRELTPTLEAHYKKYFTDRAKIVELSERYESEFTKLEDKRNSLSAELDRLKGEISANEAALDSLNSQLANDRAEMDRLSASNNFEGYNQKVPGFNSLVRRYNNLVAVAKGQVARYNSLVEEINNLATQEQALYKALDSRQETKTEQ